MGVTTTGPTTGSRPRARAVLHAAGAVLRDTRRRVRGRDLALTSAGATFYSALTVVPSVLVAVSLAGVLLGRDRTAAFGARLSSTLPEAMGAGRGTEALLRAGLALSPVGVALAVFMGTAYGEGLSRAFARFAPVPDDARPPTWWVRATTLPLLGLAPLLLSGLLVASPTLATINGRSGGWGRALAAYLSLTLVWLLLWAPLTWTYRVVGPGRPSLRAAFTGAVVAAAFVSGFLQGFLVFLAVPFDLGRPFGGLTGVGIASSLLLWLWVLHAVVLVGYSLTWATEAWLAASDRPGQRAGHRRPGAAGSRRPQAPPRRPRAASGRPTRHHPASVVRRRRPKASARAAAAPVRTTVPPSSAFVPPSRRPPRRARAPPGGRARAAVVDRPPGPARRRRGTSRGTTGGARRPRPTGAPSGPARRCRRSSPRGGSRGPRRTAAHRRRAATRRAGRPRPHAARAPPARAARRG